MSNIIRINPERGAIEGQEHLLGQVKAAAGVPTSIYSPVAQITGIIYQIAIVNTGANADIQMYLDDDGTTYDTTTIIYDTPIHANGTSYLAVYMPMNNPSGNLAVVSDTGDVNFTVWGVEISGG